MSGIAKGKAYVSEKDLKALLGIPEEVEIISLLHLGDGIELKLASKEPTLLTRSMGNNIWHQTRARKLPLGVSDKINEM